MTEPARTREPNRSLRSEKERIMFRSMAARERSAGIVWFTSASTDDDEDLTFTATKRRASEETLKMTTPRRRQSGDSTWSAASSMNDARTRVKERRRSSDGTGRRGSDHGAKSQRGTDDGVDALPSRRTRTVPGAFAVSPGQRQSANTASVLDREELEQGIDEEEALDETLVSAELVEFDGQGRLQQSSPTNESHGTATTQELPVVPAVEDHTADKLKRLYRLICLLALLLALTAVVVPTAMILSKGSNDPIPTLSPTEDATDAPSPEPSTMFPSSSPSSSPTVAQTLQPTTTRDLLLGVLRPIYGPAGQKTLEDPTTPQGAALEWLVSGDGGVAGGPDFQIVQRYVMAVFYYSLGGAGWNQKDGWLTNMNECDWYSRASQFFSVCTLDGRIEHLQVDHNNNLRGTLPSEIGLLSMLRSVQLENQFGLTGTIPTEMGLFTRLDIQFGLGGNSLSGPIPSEIGNLVDTSSLGFGGNDRLSGPVPSELGRLTRLRYISASGTSLNGTLPTELGLLTTMTSLSFASNMHRGPIPSEFGQLTALSRFLDLSENELESSIPSELGRLTTLRDLRLESNRLEGEIPRELFFMESLQDLYLSENGLIGPIPTTIGNLSSIRELYFNENKLGGQIPSEIGLAGSAGLGLRTVNLTSNQLTGTVPTEVAQLSALGSLFVNGNRLLAAPLDETICNVFDDGFHRIYMDCSTAEECGCCSHCCSFRECECVVTDDFYCS